MPQLYNAARFNIDVGKDYPALARVKRSIEKHEWLVASAPDKQPDAVL
jgi:hypothetical protein